MSLKLLALAAAVASLTLVACNTTESDADISASLMAHPWKIHSATASPVVTKDGRTITNVLDSLESACDRHTIVRYLSSDSLAIGTDSTGCGLGHGSWTRSGSIVTTIFTKDGVLDTSVYTVVSVSTTTLTVTWVATASQAPDAIPHTVTEVYLAQ